MITKTFLLILGASVALAGPVVRSSEGKTNDSPSVVQNIDARGGAASSAIAPTLQTGTPPKSSDQNFALSNNVVNTGPSASALTAGWVTPGSKTFIDICLYHHNAHRANHTAAPVTWNNTLYNWAQQKAQKCVWNEGIPGKWGPLGINIAGGTYGLPKKKPNPSGMISGLWYNSELMNYPGPWGADKPNMNNFERWGHFSQVVWSATHQIGCGLADCGDHWFGLCLYAREAGNWVGEFHKVHAPQGQPILYPNGQKSM